MTLKARHEIDSSNDDPESLMFNRRSERLGSLETLRRFFTLRNVVLACGLATVLIVLGSVASARIAVLVAVLCIFGLFVALEMAARRRWENNIVEQMQRLSSDFDRLVREVARNRNDMAGLKKSLADAGEMARSYGRNNRSAKTSSATGDGIEQRMIKAMAEQLSRIGGPSRSDRPQAEEIPLSALPEVTAENAGRVLSDDQVMQLVHNAINQDWVDLFLQPIVNLPQRKTRFFEMFSRIRIRDEIYLPAERYIAVAMRHEMVPVIDNLLLLRALQFIRDTAEEDANRAWFCNITSLTLNDPRFMGDLVEFIAQNRALAPRLVFELGQADLASMSVDSLPVLDGLSHLGCRFSMDQVRELSFDYAHLEARHIRFVKVDAALVLSEMHQKGGLHRMKRLKGELDRRGIDMITEKIESENQLIELLDIEIDYGQGYLFGKPEKDHMLLEEKR
jgi:cyclic-di-GMP phosphodiesterase, flagellum assembly factor TipF